MRLIYKHFIQITLFAVSLSVVMPVFAKERVYILAGQSNMMGKGKTYQLPAAYKRQPKNVKFYYQGRERKLARFSHFGPEVSFAHAIARAYPNDTHIIIKHVATGSSIRQWVPGTPLFNAMLRQRGFVKASPELDDALNKKELFHVDAVVWMQGESDARTAISATRYEGYLKRFIAGLRDKLNSPHSVFIMGQINPDDPAFSMVDKIQQAQSNMQKSLPNVQLVSTQDLGKIYDHVHYDTQGQMELGKRFARAFTNR